MALKKLVREQSITKIQLAQMAEEYSDISSQIKVLDSTKKKLSEKIKQAAESLGAKDDKGSFYVAAGNYMCGKVVTRSAKLDEEAALSFLRLNGLTSAIKVVEKVDEDALEKLYKEGRITEGELSAITKVEVSYKVSVKSVEEMPEIQTGSATLPLAASRKG